jgi:hypothetical protein
LLATTVLFFGFGILGFIVTLGTDDSIGGRIISGVMTVGFFYFGVRRLRLLRVHGGLAGAEPWGYSKVYAVGALWAGIETWRTVCLKGRRSVRQRPG